MDRLAFSSRAIRPTPKGFSSACAACLCCQSFEARPRQRHPVRWCCAPRGQACRRGSRHRSSSSLVQLGASLVSERVPACCPKPLCVFIALRFPGSRPAAWTTHTVWLQRRRLWRLTLTNKPSPTHKHACRRSLFDGLPLSAKASNSLLPTPTSWQAARVSSPSLRKPLVRACKLTA